MKNSMKDKIEIVRQNLILMGSAKGSISDEEEGNRYVDELVLKTIELIKNINSLDGLAFILQDIPESKDLEFKCGKSKIVLNALDNMINEKENPNLISMGDKIKRKTKLENISKKLKKHKVIYRLGILW